MKKKDPTDNPIFQILGILFDSGMQTDSCLRWPARIIVLGIIVFIYYKIGFENWLYLTAGILWGLLGLLILILIVKIHGK